MPEPDQDDARPWRRNWLSFRLTTLFAIITLIAIAAASPRVYRQIQIARFQSYAGKDLRSLPESERKKLRAIINDLQPHLIIEKNFRPNDLWYLWRMQTGKETRFVLFHSSTAALVAPSDSHAYLRIFHADGQQIGSAYFTTGWHIEITDAAVISEPGFDASILRIDTDAVVPEEIEQQYYALQDDQFLLLRLVDGRGTPVRNNYLVPRHQIGPESPTRSEAEWIAALSDPRPAEKLRTLTWLAGEHGLPGEPDYDLTKTAGPEAELVQELRANPEVRATVTGYLESDNPWIVDAARLALESMTRPLEANPNVP